MNHALTNIIRFFALVTVQILVLNKIQISGYINPYIYILFILLLPIKTPKWLLLVLGFVLGFTIDLFTGIMGLHTFATLLIAFFRPVILNIVLSDDDKEAALEPGLINYGVIKFIYFAGLLTFMHHLFLFFLEVYALGEFFDTLLRSVINTIVSIICMILTLMLFSKKRDDRTI
ncbi:MAG: rod shape-determining protein MreD [Bacteroidales bacterium]|nr:rod shape-determining protein MreD [Bacteroidales bacterium]